MMRGNPQRQDRRLVFARAVAGDEGPGDEAAAGRPLDLLRAAGDQQAIARGGREG